VLEQQVATYGEQQDHEGDCDPCDSDGLLKP